MDPNEFCIVARRLAEHCFHHTMYNIVYFNTTVKFCNKIRQDSARNSHVIVCLYEQQTNLSEALCASFHSWLQQCSRTLNLLTGGVNYLKRSWRSSVALGKMFKESVFLSFVCSIIRNICAYCFQCLFLPLKALLKFGMRQHPNCTDAVDSEGKLMFLFVPDGVTKGVVYIYFFVSCCKIRGTI